MGDGAENEAIYLQRYIRRSGFDGEDPLVKEVCLLSCTARIFYAQFPCLHPEHPSFELGRLYPSLISESGGARLYLSNFGVASDPHTYRALGIRFVVNCTRDLPFVDELVAQLREANGQAAGAGERPIRAEDVALIARLRVPVDEPWSQGRHLEGGGCWVSGLAKVGDFLSL